MTYSNLNRKVSQWFRPLLNPALVRSVHPSRRRGALKSAGIKASSSTSWQCSAWQEICKYVLICTCKSKTICNSRCKCKFSLNVHVCVKDMHIGFAQLIFSSAPWWRMACGAASKTRTYGFFFRCFLLLFVLRQFSLLFILKLRSFILQGGHLGAKITILEGICSALDLESLVCSVLQHSWARIS
jgi:hypothetical protein